jgi:hypothetical protein
MYKSISYYKNIANKFLVENDKTFSSAIVNESRQAKTKYSQGGTLDKDEFDIFLSHSFLDRLTIFGIYKDFESLGYKTYVDWIVDPTLDRNNITKVTAAKIRMRMNQSKCLIYATSFNIVGSIWMPWELGYMDGTKNEKFAVFPLKKEDEEEEDINLPEYLELYYSCSKEKNTKKKEMLWINEDLNTYISFDEWLKKNRKPFKRS